MGPAREELLDAGGWRLRELRFIDLECLSVTERGTSGFVPLPWSIRSTSHSQYIIDAKRQNRTDVLLSGRMSHVAEDVFQLEVECACGWRGKMVGYRAHLVREHCSVNGCGASASALVSFGYRDPGFIRVGASLGVCPRHRQHLRAGRMHMIVEELPTAARR